ncbi:hypothetical protein GQ53DRAFT_263823 [Thozetella sp. PMI_491]|nr:hypothetical protein GQ53DRAFT_263823 [Thozetella sp. PMI_491]
MKWRVDIVMYNSHQTSPIRRSDPFATSTAPFSQPINIVQQPHSSTPPATSQAQECLKGIIVPPETYQARSSVSQRR